MRPTVLPKPYTPNSDDTFVPFSDNGTVLAIAASDLGAMMSASNDVCVCFIESTASHIPSVAWQVMVEGIDSSRNPEDISE